MLLYIYGKEISENDPKDWEAWMDLVVTADNYLKTELKHTAYGRLREVALEQTDGEIITGIIVAVQAGKSPYHYCGQLAETLHKRSISRAFCLSLIHI